MSHFFSLFEHHSYLILFAVTALELIALPVSSEFFMSYAGYFVFQGKMNYILTVLAAFAAAGLAVTITYWIGRLGGYRLVERYGRYFHFGPKQYEKTAAWFDKSGKGLLLFAYFLPGVRHLTGYFAGISKMPFRTYMLLSYIGASLWAFCFISLGVLLGPKWETFHQFAGRYLLVLVVIVGLFLAVLTAYRLYRKPIRHFFSQYFAKLLTHFHTIRATGIFLIFLFAAFIGMMALMIGIAQDYLNNEFTRFNEVAGIIGHRLFALPGIQGTENVILFFQSTYVLGAAVFCSMLIIWKREPERRLETVMTAVILGGGPLYFYLVKKALGLVHSLVTANLPLSPSFPYEYSMTAIIVYGTCLFVLLRHSYSKRVQLFAPVLCVFLLLSLAAAEIAKYSILPGDLAGGYVFGTVWIVFNFLLFELIRVGVR
ncbi:DedA family protein [Metabacillus sp. GX 13764]|uniref:DedA family protein n=1 Tax=Metabacillus kandeliae TaxID=2900151 RepID=UPI001E348A94|nr:DedA family protein [Metabacillus kandeliae]MCD7035670.1 DedA family protein [Metabacillus kandeliae]